METERSAPEPGLRTPAPSSLLALPHGGHSSRNARAFGGGSPSPGRAEPRGLQRRREFRSRSGRTPGASPRFSTRAHRRAVQPVRSPEGRGTGAQGGSRAAPPPRGPPPAPRAPARPPRRAGGTHPAPAGNAWSEPSRGSGGGGGCADLQAGAGDYSYPSLVVFFFFSLKNNSLAHTARWGSKE